MAATIEITGLRVDRGGATVLHDLTLSIDGGVVTGLLGPSGSGKSTLIRSIVGVQVVAAGDVCVLGLPAGAPALRSRVAYVTQAPSVYGDLSVRENLTYFARVLGAPPASVEAVIERVGLADMAAHLVGRLSGGQRARASLATALLNDPDVLVLDDWGLGTVTDRHRHDLLEILEDRDGARSTVITSQLPRER